MPLSSNSLIHLTKYKGALIGILENNFLIQYCMEEILTKKGDIVCAMPMVSFCDIPLSEIKNHISNYGHYGIGLKKAWAISKGLNPIMYIEKESDLGAELRTVGATLLKDKDFKNLSDIDYALFNFFRYMKNYQGDFKRNGNVIKNYRYSDEREWRYVPNKNEAKIFVAKNDFKNDTQKNQENNNINHLRLEFTPDDINYIIINNDSEISDIIDVIKNVKGKNYTYQQVERLMTRILTTDQIETDI